MSVKFSSNTPAAPTGMVLGTWQYDGTTGSWVPGGKRW